MRNNVTLKEGTTNALLKAHNIISRLICESEFDSEELASLYNGRQMFERDTTLETFSTPLPKLEVGDNMFMFCIRLTSFTSKLRKLHSGYYMFCGCRNLREFKSSLSNLDTGLMMFSGCRLDLESVKCIAKTIKTQRNKKFHHIDIGVDESLRGDEELEMCIDKIKGKGWKVSVEYN